MIFCKKIKNYLSKEGDIMKNKKKFSNCQPWGGLLQTSYDILKYKNIILIKYMDVGNFMPRFSCAFF